MTRHTVGCTHIYGGAITRDHSENIFRIDRVLSRYRRDMKRHKYELTHLHRNKGVAILQFSGGDYPTFTVLAIAKTAQ